MKKNCRRLTGLAFLALIVGLVAGRGGAGEGRGPANQEDSWAAYRIIVERNMFSRQRGPRMDQSGRQRMSAPAPTPESYYVLKGIVQEDGVFIGFLEDNQRGRILRVHKGDKVARGVITELTLDSVQYQFGDRTVKVAMGFDLEGGQGRITFDQMYELSQAYTATASEEEGESESSAPSADEAAILKQLMERRRQQIGQ
ncbi:MAG: hypothetical protein ACYSWW_25960 [Planctomycetota bacterium]